MKKISENVIFALLASILLAGITGYEKKKGPMERADEKIDKVTEKTGDTIKKAGKKIKDAAH